MATTNIRPEKLQGIEIRPRPLVKAGVHHMDSAVVTSVRSAIPCVLKLRRNNRTYCWS